MLSPHFSQTELTVTTTGLKNDPGPKELANLAVTASLLEQIRSLLGHPIRVNSGYRSPAVNKKVGGVATSDHLTGCAADFVCPAFGTPYEICKAIEASGIKFGQMIQEGSWVHVSWKTNARPLLTLKNGKYVPGIVRS